MGESSNARQLHVIPNREMFIGVTLGNLLFDTTDTHANRGRRSCRKRVTALGHAADWRVYPQRETPNDGGEAPGAKIPEGQAPRTV